MTSRPNKQSEYRSQTLSYSILSYPQDELFESTSSILEKSK